MRFETYSASLLPAIVRFWNRSSKHEAHFLRMTARVFRERVARPPGFDPEGFIAARTPRGLAGFIHVGRRGRQGFVAFLWVDPSHRRKGLGTRLWHAGLERARQAGQVVVLNPWDNPYYGGGKARDPLWGPWGPAVAWRDSATLKFLARKGYAPQSRAVHLALEIAPEKARKGKRELRLVPGGREVVGARPGAMKETLESWVARMKRTGGGRAEALTFPDLRPEEHRAFVETGFQPVAAWAVF
jgi:GNAT superfamily N-acetyltransferase